MRIERPSVMTAKYGTSVKRPVQKTVSIVMAIMLAGKITGVVRDRLQAVYYGTDTAEGIAFMQASMLPRNFLDIMFASVISASFIPVFNMYLEKKGNKAAMELAARFISLTLALTGIITLICVLCATPIYAVFLDGAALSLDTRLLGIRLLRIMFPLMILSGAAFSLTGIVQSMGQFYIPAAMSLVSNSIIIAYFIFFIDCFGIYGLCAAFLLGWAAQAAIQIPFLVKIKLRFRFGINWRNDGIRQIIVLAGPVMVASWAAPINLLVNGKASINLYGGQHGYNAINLANGLFTIIAGVYVLSVTNVLFPTLSKQAANNDEVGFEKTLRDALRSLFFWLLPLTFGLMALSRPLVNFIYRGGLFQEESTAITATALFYLSVGVVGYGLQIVLSRACYAMQNGQAPLLSALAAIGLNAALSFLLVRTPLMVGGPALASALSITVAGVMLLYVVAKKLPGLWPRQMTVDTLKMLGASAVMGAALVFCRNMVLSYTGSRNETVFMRILALGLPAAAGVVVYFMGCFALRVGEAKTIVVTVFQTVRRIRIRTYL